MSDSTEWASNRAASEETPLTGPKDTELGVCDKAAASDTLPVCLMDEKDEEARERHHCHFRECRMVMFAIGGLVMSAFLWYSMQIEGAVPGREQLEERKRLESMQRSLLEEMQMRLHGLQLGQQIQSTERQHPDKGAEDADLMGLYCKNFSTFTMREWGPPEGMNEEILKHPAPPRQEMDDPQLLLQDMLDSVDGLDANGGIATGVAGSVAGNPVADTVSLPLPPSLGWTMWYFHVPHQVSSALTLPSLRGPPEQDKNESIESTSAEKDAIIEDRDAEKDATKHQDQENASTHEVSARRLGGSGERRAFIMMSYDHPGRPLEHLWNTLPVAMALRRFSSYPVVLLTNHSRFPDGKLVKTALRALNVEVRLLSQLHMPPQLARARMTPTWAVAYWKLQIWALTDFDKLIWLDSDSIVFRNIDWLFERDWMWSQRDDWFCKMNQTSPCSGLMLMFPNIDDYHGLLDFAKTLNSLPGGDQQLIKMYFARKGKPINLLSDLEASFGQCVGKASTPYLDPTGKSVAGSWSVPSFVHKSGGWGDTNNNVYNNVCFSLNMTRQRYRLGRTVINICQYHPLGPYWRDLFCDATSTLGLEVPLVHTFCNDTCWYQGIQPASQGEACGPLDASPGNELYYGRHVGWPIPEEASFL